MKSFPRMIAGVALAAASSEAFASDLVDTAVSAGQFTILVRAVQEAGLVDLSAVAADSHRAHWFRRLRSGIHWPYIEAFALHIMHGRQTWPAFCGACRDGCTPGLICVTFFRTKITGQLCAVTITLLAEEQ